MAIYNAWCDRVPIYIIIGNYNDAAIRRPAEWYHGVQDAAGLVRDFTKWDDTPWSLTHFAESAVRAYKVALTPPMAPVVLVADGVLQEDPIPDRDRLSIPKLALPVPPQGDSGAVDEVARLLVGAANPVLIVDRLARTPAAIPLLIELAETLQAAVIDKGGRMNFPTRHFLNQSERAGAVVASADVILGLEVTDFWGAVNAFRDQQHRSTRPLTKSGTRLITITTGDLYIRSNYQDFRRLADVDLAIAADGEATLPALLEAVKRRTTGDRRRAFEERGAKLREASRVTHENARAAASYAWDASPVSTGRLCAEIWGQIKNEDWSLVSSYYSDGGGWPRRLWDFNKPYHWLGDAGGGGIGYGAPASVGAALANRRHGRFSVAIQTDGDLVWLPRRTLDRGSPPHPALERGNNNRAYTWRRCTCSACAIAATRIDRGLIGSTLTEPNMDYAKLAQAWASTRRVRFPIRRIWVRRWRAPLPSSSAASRRWSTSSRRFVEDRDDATGATCLWKRGRRRALDGGGGRCRESVAHAGHSSGAGRFAWRCGKGQGALFEKRLLSVPQQRSARRRPARGSAPIPIRSRGSWRMCAHGAGCRRSPRR
jgi:acetolactate synthase-1/2/3 large subunit